MLTSGMTTALAVLLSTAFFFLAASAVLVGFYKKFKPVYELLFKNPYLARMKEPFGMRQAPCPIGELRGAQKQIQWWEGRSRDLPVGILGPFLWLGGDEAGSLADFVRGPSGVFTRLGGSLGPSEAIVAAETAKLSRAVQALSIYRKALRVTLAFEGGDPKVFVDSDLPRLESILAELSRF